MNAAATKKAAPAERKRDTGRSSEGQRQAGEQSQPTNQRSGAEDHGGSRASLWAAGMRAENVNVELTYKVDPLLALCQFAAQAHHVLSAFGFAANGDPLLDERLAEVDPAWRTALDDSEGGLMSHISHCMLLARSLCQQAAGEAMKAVDEIHKAPKGGAQ